MGSKPPSETASPPAAEMAVHPLLDFGALQARLHRELELGDYLAAFVCAAAMSQLLGDHLQRELWPRQAVDRTLRHLGHEPGRQAAGALSALHRVAVRPRQLTETSLLDWSRQLAGVVDELAARVTGESVATTTAELQAQIGLRRLPGSLTRRILQLPTCFQSLDQRPEDGRLLAAEFATTHPDRDRPVLMVGLRTSGSYLAPLLASWLRREGFDAESMTLRPGLELLPAEANRIRSAVARNALFVITDDPPRTGRSIIKAAGQLGALGAPRQAISAMAGLAGTDGVPPPLRELDGSYLPWERWSVHAALEPGAVREHLANLLPGRTVPPAGGGPKLLVRSVEAVERLPLEPMTHLMSGSPRRRHVRARYRVRVCDGGGGEAVTDIYVKGIGLSLFGEPSQVAAARLAGYLPEVYGFAAGLMFRAWLAQPVAFGAAGLPAQVASYTNARRRLLPVSDDPTQRLSGRDPAWQRASNLVGDSFGRFRPLVRPLLHRAARRLLAVSDPCVADAGMGPDNWRDDGGALLKVDFDERGFANQDTHTDQLFSFDPAFDLAAASALAGLAGPLDAPRSEWDHVLLDAYRQGGGPAISAERWFLYRALHLASLRHFTEDTLADELAGATANVPERWDPSPAEVTDRCELGMTMFSHRYLAGVLLAGLQDQPPGPLCAIDVDGVLETMRLGFSAASPAALRAIRALAAHGYSPLLASGRGGVEVRARSRVLGMDQGVAEYGAVVFRGDSQTDLLQPAERDLMERLRGALVGAAGIELHGTHSAIIRASERSRSGRREPLTESRLGELFSRLGMEGYVLAVHGLRQTDLLPASLDKVRGIDQLLAAVPGRELALAVGDTGSDLGMLRRARLGVAPGNADQAIRASGLPVMRGYWQLGLAQAVGILIGHAPGGCPACRMPRLDADAALLIALLGAHDGGRAGKVRAAAGMLRALSRHPERPLTPH